MGHDERRTDARRNRADLLDAVGRLLARDGVVTLTGVAAEAGVSRATTYRNFSSIDAAVHAYVERFIGDFDERAGAAASLDEVSRLWGELVTDRARALVHVRSTEGFLAVERRGEPIIATIAGVVRRAIRRDPRLAGLDEPARDLALFLWNALLDPRELLDLAEHTGTTVSEAAALMCDAVYAGLAAS